MLKRQTIRPFTIEPIRSKPKSKALLGLAFPPNTADQYAAYKLTVAILSLMYGYTLASLPVDIFVDRQNYINYANHSHLLLEHYATDLSFFFNEPLWLLCNVWLASLFEAEMVIRSVIFFSATSVAYVVLSTDRRLFPILVFILLIPFCTKLFIVQLRQGLAVAFFLLGWRSSNTYSRVALIGATPFIHSSFFIVLLLLTMTYIFRRLRWSNLSCLLGFCGLSITIAMMLQFLTIFLGARQAARYEFVAAETTGLGFLFWFGVLLLLLHERSDYIRAHMFSFGCIIFYLSTFFFIEVTARVFASAFLVAVLSGLQSHTWRFHAFVAMVLTYGAILIGMRLEEPWLGFVRI